MRRAAGLFAAVTAVAACASSPSSSSSPGPNTVSTFVWGAPTLIAYRDGEGPWLTPTSDGAGTYQLHVTDGYQLVVTCSDPTGFTTKLRARTFGDGATDFVWCMNHGDPFATVLVTGEMTQPGFVSMYDYASSTTAAWSFALDVTPGVHDLGATGDGHFARRRDVYIPDAATLPTIDVDAEGDPLVATPLAVTGLQSDDQLTSEVDVYTALDVVTSPAVAGTTAQIVPQSQLVTGDQIDLFVTAADASSVRTADTWFTGSETSFAMPAPLSGVTFARRDTVHATWDTLPAYDELALQLAANGPGWSSVQELSASASWLAEQGATDLAFALDPLPPRFQQAWTIDLDQAYTRALVATRDGDTVFTTSYREGVNGAAAATARGHAHPRVGATASR